LINQEANDDSKILRLSLDAKATVKIGSFSREGKNRVETEACDHDFSNSAKLTPILFNFGMIFSLAVP
jgi:hypothetical protein